MYMYTHIERWWLSVLLLLTGREKDQCRGGVLQEKLHKYNNICNIPQCSLHLPNYQDMFCEFVPSFCYICLFCGCEWIRKAEKHTTGLKNCLLPSPLCTGLYLMYIRSHCSLLGLQRVVLNELVP